MSRYQPARGLKGRKGGAVAFEDILYYQKIIVAPMETRRVMEQVNSVGFGSLLHQNVEKLNHRSFQCLRFVYSPSRGGK